MKMEELYINHWAVIVAAISMFVLGGLWYGPLFGNQWMQANGFSEEDLKKANPAKQYGLSLLFSIIMAYNLAAFLGDLGTTIAWGATAGFLAGFGWVMLSIGIISFFEQRSWKYIFINGGYMTIAFTLMGTIIGAWR
jgi:hypothetical protein